MPVPLWSMSRVRVAAAVLVLFGATSAGLAAEVPTPASAASAADVQALIDAKNYSGAVSAASRLVNKTGAAAAGLDKGALYALKGEAHLRLKQASLAADAFGRASKAATDPKLAAGDAATATLLKRSSAGVYKPKQPGRDGQKLAPFDLFTTDDLTPALGCLFDDEFAASAPKLKAAKTATTVPQLLQAATLATDLRQLEVAATGDDTRTKPDVVDIAQHAHELLATNLRTMAARVTDIRTAANTTNTNYRQVRQPNGSYLNLPVQTKAGLTSSNTSDLQSIQSTANQIGPAADAFAKATADAQSAGGAGGWDAVTAEAARVAAAAGDVLNADYGKGSGSGHVR
jgi:hypothetical protein